MSQNLWLSALSSQLIAAKNILSDKEKEVQIVFSYGNSIASKLVHNKDKSETNDIGVIQFHAEIITVDIRGKLVGDWISDGRNTREHVDWDQIIIW